MEWYWWVIGGETLVILIGGLVFLQMTKLLDTMASWILALFVRQNLG